MTYPLSFRTLKSTETVSYPELFDPALKQYPCAFRPGEPSFARPDDRRRWLRTRERLWGLLLYDIAQSRWHDHLMLRGSLLLKNWLGDLARDFADADWVALPSTLAMTSSQARDLFADLEQIAKHGSLANAAGVTHKTVTWDDIWTYDRVPGRRMMIYWHDAVVGVGSLQMDFVFGEEPWEPPIMTPVIIGEAAPASLWTASPALSLAWKLLWLDTDMYPQGKDLYDAVLLAERVTLPRRLYELALADRIKRQGPDAAVPLLVTGEWQVDWKDFQREYPVLGGDAADYQTRLAVALTKCLQ